MNYIIGSKLKDKSVIFNLYLSEEVREIKANITKPLTHVQFTDKVTQKLSSLTNNSWLCYSINDKGLRRFKELGDNNLSTELRNYLIEHYPEEMI